MKKRTRISAAGLLAGMLLVGALLFERVCGFSLTRGFAPTPVKDMYLIVNPEEHLYLSIDCTPSGLPFTRMRVIPDDITLAVDSSRPEDLAISSQDPSIWGNRWPWVENVTLTLKTEKQRTGFEELFTAEKLHELREGAKKPLAYGITKYGMLTSEGRILGY